MKNVLYKLHELIYPPKTPLIDESKDSFLGLVRLRDVPESIDDFYRLIFASFRHKWGWLERIGLSPSKILPKRRFVSFSEFKEAFTKRSSSFIELREKYPIYRLANLGNHTQQDDFIRAYEIKGLDGYFYLMGKKNKKMFQLFNDWHKAYLPYNERGRHTYIIWKSWCWKSELMKNLIIQDILNNNSSVIVIAPDGDMCNEIARQKGLDKERLIYIDCSITAFTPIINPIELILNKEDHLSVQNQAQIIKDALVQMCNLNGQPLTNQMQSLVQPCLDIIIAKGGTLYDMQKIIDDVADNAELVDLGKQHPKHGYLFQNRFDRSNLRESKNGIYQKLQEILNLSSVSDFFCGTTTIDLPNEIEQKKVIIFNLSKGHLWRFWSLYIGRMIISILQNIIFQRVKLEKKDRTPISLYIDEFQDFINKSIEEIFRQGRKYGVDLTVATQTVGQGMDIDMTTSVLSNTNIKFAGQNDYKNTRTMSNETGTELEVLQKLQRGEFLTRVSNGRAFVLSCNTAYLDTNTCINNKEWEEVLDNQIKKYYTKRPDFFTPPPPPLWIISNSKNEKEQTNKLNKEDAVFIPLYE